MSTRNLVVFSYIFIISSKLFAQNEAAEVGFRFKADCLFDLNRKTGADQDCLRVSDLAINIKQKYKKGLVATVGLSPTYHPDSQFRASALSHKYNSTSENQAQIGQRFGVVEHYKFSWQARPGLQISIGSYSGVSRFNSLNQMSLAAPFNESGWDQSALGIEYLLGSSEAMGVQFVLGNGEGENFQNLDVQQYAGFQFYSEVSPGAKIELAISSDGNDVGSLSHQQMQMEYEEKCEFDSEPLDKKRGFSAQRMAGSVAFDERLLKLSGFSTKLSWFRHIISDLDEKKDSVHSIEQQRSCNKIPLSVHSIRIEDPEHTIKNVIAKKIIQFEFAYALNEFNRFVFDYKTRSLNSSIPFTGVCISQSEGICTQSGELLRTINDNGWALGLVHQFEEGLLANLEYASYSYDELYDRFNYIKEGKIAKDSEWVNLRLAYEW